jgi:hypothetical protein
MNSAIDLLRLIRFTNEAEGQGSDLSLEGCLARAAGPVESIAQCTQANCVRDRGS